MTVNVHRDGHGRMSKSFLRHLRVDSTSEQVSCMSVPEVMKADSRLAALGPEVPCMGQRAGLHRAAILLRIDQRVPRQSPAHLFEFRLLLCTMLAEFGDG